MQLGLRDKYLTIDPRGLGAGRIALAIVLIVDLARRLPFATLWYSNEGLLPNHTVLWRPTSGYVFSLFFAASLPHEAMIGFGLCGAIYLLLLVGLKTRLAQLGSLIAVLSLHGRNLFIQNSGDVVLVELCVWTSFLPLGRRYSIDAVRARLPDRTPVVSWAVLAIVAQLAVIYLFNAVQKTGPGWRDGTAVHYVLYYANIVTALGVWVRGWITPRMCQLLTWSTRVTEAALPLLLLTPFVRRHARWFAIALVAGLHIGIGLFLNLGIFVPAMLVFIPFLVPASDWDRLERLWARSTLVAIISAFALRVAPRAPAREQTTAVSSPASYSARIREGAVLALMTFAAAGAVFDNPGITHVPAALEPPAVAAVLGYLQMYQVWTMFAPDVRTTEQTVAVDAVTADGRHVDPLNEALSPGHPLQGGTIPPRLGNNGFASAYLGHLPDSPDYFTALGEWLLKYPDRTHRATDRIVSFRVLAVEQPEPPPGQRQPGDPRWNLLFGHPN